MQRPRMLLAAALLAALTSCGKRPDSTPPGPTAPLVAWNTPTPSPDRPADPYFVDVAEGAGLKTVLYCGGPDKDHILESVGSGCAFVDYDGDGRLDVYLVNAWALDEQPSRVRLKGRNALYRNRGDGTFEDVTARAGVADESWGCGVCAG